MKFGTVERPDLVDFSLPHTHRDTYQVLKQSDNEPLEVFVGCAKWNKQDLKGFYPRGTKDELPYYSRQFNSIEMNTTFYHFPRREQVKIWKDKTPDGFKFFPKITNTISHFKQLKEVKDLLNAYCEEILHFEEKLGMVFLQLHGNFSPKRIDRLERALIDFPVEVPLSVEVRHPEWFESPANDQLYDFLKKYHKANIIVDTAGRRDMLHMRLSTSSAFIRWVGANHESDYTRLDEWIEVIKDWKSAGLERLYFFVHQNIEKESPLLSAYFIRKLNDVIGVNLKIPETL
ncbi:MAG: DUF72 domain-containing protein [Bacteroidota bacterium]